MIIARQISHLPHCSTSPSASVYSIFVLWTRHAKRKHLSAATEAAHKKNVSKLQLRLWMHYVHLHCSLLRQLVFVAEDTVILSQKKQKQKSKSQKQHLRRTVFAFSSQTRTHKAYVPGTTYYNYWRTKMRRRHAANIQYRPQSKEKMRSKYAQRSD